MPTSGNSAESLCSAAARYMPTKVILTALQFFVNALVAPLQHGKSGFFGVAHRERFGHRRGIDPRDHLFHWVLAERTGHQWVAVHRTSELEPTGTDATRMLRVIRGFRYVFVNWHKGDAGREFSVLRQKSIRRDRLLPARFGHSREHSGRCQLAERDPGEPETTQERAAATSNCATVHEPGRAGVTRQHRQADVILVRFELPAEFSVFFDGLFFARIAGDPTFLSHNSGRRCYGLSRTLQAQSPPMVQLILSLWPTDPCGRA